MRIHRRSAEGRHAGNGDGLSASRPFGAAPLQRNRASPGDFSAKSTGAVSKEEQPRRGTAGCTASGRLPKWARDRANTDELVQKTLIQTFKRIEHFEPRRVGALQAYLRQAVLNRIRNEL